MAEGDNGGLDQNAAAPTMPQFTKRRQIGFFKIRSKPINKPTVQQKPGRKLPRIEIELYEWVISIAAGSIAAAFLKYKGYSFILAFSAGIASYLVLFVILVALRLILRKTTADEILARLSAGNEQKLMKQNRDQINAAEKAALQLQWKNKPMPVKTKTVKTKMVGERGPNGPLATYINSTLKARRTLELSLREIGIRKSPYEFVKSMMLYAAVIGVAITLVLLVLLNHFGVTLILAPVFGFAIYMVMFNRFLLFPVRRTKAIGKLVERDILFAARDIVIGMRSGMPLFNAITAVSTGFGETSKEFGKIIELVQLGLPIEEAMEEISEKSESKTFKRLMLQASVSIKAGVDVTSALQDVVDEVTQERIIDLRKYGQKLNALAMFYMLFGVIFPSMGIAVVTIMSTFINIFPVTYVVLILALVFIAFVQLVLMNIMRTSRPIFSM